jgi:2-amino-4-hydroxy-6-hydroxymethyldihydropteridine diphosphokinase / dihydropteroate synthase
MFKLGPRELLLGLGSNSADAMEMLRAARALLRAHPRLRLLQCSPIYESDALLPEGAPDSWNLPFRNAALLMEWREGALRGPERAEEIVALLKSIEQKLGRKAGPRWSPRCIDLDLLAWGGPAVATEIVNVPHRELGNRPFAFLPAEDCASALAPTREQRAWRFAEPEAVPSRTRRSARDSWPALVAILNLTPDSFSDGGKLAHPDAMENAVRSAVAAGASILDLGAESTRPGASPVSPAEEQARLAPVLERARNWKSLFGCKISVDSRHPETLRWALERFPLDWANDVGGFTDPNMLEAVALHGCRLVAMHSLGVPPSPHIVLPAAEDPLEILQAWACERMRAFAAAGIAESRVILDPGLGFGKTSAQSLALLRQAAALGTFGPSWLIGHSRKRFLDPLGNVPAAERELETAALSASLACSGVDFLRVHSPALQARALSLGNRFA